MKFVPRFHVVYVEHLLVSLNKNVSKGTCESLTNIYALKFCILCADKLNNKSINVWNEVCSTFSCCVCGARAPRKNNVSKGTCQSLTTAILMIVEGRKTSFTVFSTSLLFENHGKAWNWPSNIVRIVSKVTKSRQLPDCDLDSDKEYCWTPWLWLRLRLRQRIQHPDYDSDLDWDTEYSTLNNKVGAC